MSLDPRIPGAALTLALTALVWVAAARAGVDPITPALLVGLALAHAPGVPQSTAPGVVWVANRVLEASVVALGLKLDASALLEVGASGLLLALGSLALAIASARVLGAQFGLTRPLTELIGVGSGVCGSSAIAATAPVLADKRPEETGLALGAIYVVGTTSLFALPAVGSVLGLEPRDAAVLVGGSLQSMGHVVAAGFALGEEAGPLAVTVKLARVAMLPAVALWLASSKARPQGTQLLPGFLVAFIVAAGARSLGLVPEAVAAPAGVVGKLLVTWAMVGVGARIHVRQLLADGPRAVGVAFAVAALQLGWLALGLWAGL